MKLANEALVTKPQSEVASISEALGDVYDSSRAWPAWLLLSAVLVVLDQAAKQYFSGVLELGSRHVMTSFFNLVHTRNYGAAFSFLADAGGWQRYFFLSLAALVVVFLIVLIVRGVTTRLETFAYALIISGALANALDRVRLGYVVDFLDFHWKEWHWPAFNLADICISTGAVCLVVVSLFSTRARVRA